MYLDDLITELGSAGRKRAEVEFTLQKAVCSYLKTVLPRSAFFYSVPNGGLRQSAVARKLAATGCKAGVPDLALVFQGRAYFIEMKAPKGVLSEVQKQVHERLDLAGCQDQKVVARSIDEVRQALRSWGVPINDRTS